MDGLMIARLGLGLLGVLAAVQGLIAFPRLAGVAAEVSAAVGSPTALFAVALPFLTVWFVSYYLVFRNHSLAQFMAADTHLRTGTGTPTFNEVAVGLVGVLVMVYALPNLIASIGVGTISGFGPELKQYTIGYVAQTVVGAILLLWPQHLVALWLRARKVASPGSGTADAAV